MPSAQGDKAATSTPSVQGNNAAAPTHRGQGKIEAIGKEDVTISHGPIPSLQWGAMTMPFKLPTGGLPKNIAVGDTVTFELRAMKDGMYEITSIAPTGAAPAQPSGGRGRDAPKGGVQGGMTGGMDRKGMNMPGSQSGAAQ